LNLFYEIDCFIKTIIEQMGEKKVLLTEGSGLAEVFFLEILYYEISLK